MLEELFAMADRMQRLVKMQKERDPYDEELASEMRKYSLLYKIMLVTFFEASTRTSTSFAAAMLRLDGKVISMNEAGEFSSVVKGESYEDMFRVMAGYGDTMVIRHPGVKPKVKGDSLLSASIIAASVSDIPVINAGDGPVQHPTQSLLDAYTIWKHFGRLDGLTVALMGDLKYSRTVRSLAYLLTKFNNIKIIFISPHQLRVKDDIKDYLKQCDVAFEERDNWKGILDQIDVFYMTRPQKERTSDDDEHGDYEGFVLTPAEVAAMDAGAIIMHPLPRNDEISPSVDVLPQAIYFLQARYGLFIRMALLLLLLKSHLFKEQLIPFDEAMR